MEQNHSFERQNNGAFACNLIPVDACRVNQVTRIKLPPII